MVSTLYRETGKTQQKDKIPGYLMKLDLEAILYFGVQFVHEINLQLRMGGRADRIRGVIAAA
jgi:hypothetical protein